MGAGAGRPRENLPREPSGGQAPAAACGMLPRRQIELERHLPPPAPETPMPGHRPPLRRSMTGPGSSCLALFAFALSGFALAGCGDGGPPAGEGPVVRDSAGVEVVEYLDGLPAAPEWEAAMDDAVHLAGELFQVRGAVRFDAGRVAVADGGGLRVRFFESDGSAAQPGGGPREVGRDGEGPGEFRHLSAMMRWPGDSLLVWDRQLRRLSIFDHQGGLGRTFDLEVTERVPFAQPRGVFGDASILGSGFSQTPPGGPEGGRQRYPSPTYRFGPEGDLREELGLAFAPESYFEMVRGGFTVLPVLFPRATRLVAGPDVLVEAASDHFQLQIRTPEGELLRMIRVGGELPRITDRMRQELIEVQMDEGVAGARDPGEVRTALEGMPVPERLPAFDRLAVDRLGYIWVELYPEIPGSTSRWVVFGPDGEVAGQIELPRRFEPLEIGSDYMVGVLTDELDVEHVVVAELERRLE